MTVTSYLNTDLDLEASDDLSGLTRAFEEREWLALHSGTHPDGKWRASYEYLWRSDAGPDDTISGMLDVIEGLGADLKGLWAACSKRDFNIGFEGGSEPHSTMITLPPDLIARTAAVGASVSFTIYAPARRARSSTRARRRRAGIQAEIYLANVGDIPAAGDKVREIATRYQCSSSIGRSVKTKSRHYRRHCGCVVQVIAESVNRARRVQG